MNFTKDFPNHSYNKFTGKKVKIICTRERELIGKVLGFESALNNYRGADSLCIYCDNLPYGTVEVLETEIESITLL